MLPLKKLYVDSKFKTPDSNSNAKFKIELPDSLTLPNNTVFYIDDVCIPHSWYTIESGINDKLFMRFADFPTQDSNFTDHIITLESKSYTGPDLVTEIQVKLNSLYPSIFTVAFNAAKHTLSIATSSSTKMFKMLTYNDIISKVSNTWKGPSYDVKNSNDITDILKLTEGFAMWNDTTNPFISGPLALQPIRNIYISSPNLGNFNTLGPRGESSIIKKVPVTADYNQMIFDQVMAGNDFLDCSRQTLKTIEFHFKDVNGNLIPFHGSNVSFSIIFDQLNPNV